jgi:hypothetical protein
MVFASTVELGLSLKPNPSSKPFFAAKSHTTNDAHLPVQNP